MLLNRGEMPDQAKQIRAGRHAGDALLLNGQIRRRPDDRIPNPVKEEQEHLVRLPQVAAKAITHCRPRLGPLWAVVHPVRPAARWPVHKLGTIILSCGKQ